MFGTHIDLGLEALGLRMHTDSKLFLTDCDNASNPSPWKALIKNPPFALKTRKEKSKANSAK